MVIHMDYQKTLRRAALDGKLFEMADIPHTLFKIRIPQEKIASLFRFSKIQVC